MLPSTFPCRFTFDVFSFFFPVALHGLPIFELSHCVKSLLLPNKALLRIFLSSKTLFPFRCLSALPPRLILINRMTYPPYPSFVVPPPSPLSLALFARILTFFPRCGQGIFLLTFLTF